MVDTDYKFCKKVCLFYPKLTDPKVDHSYLPIVFSRSVARLSIQVAVEFFSSFKAYFNCNFSKLSKYLNPNISPPHTACKASLFYRKDLVLHKLVIYLLWNYIYPCSEDNLHTHVGLYPKSEAQTYSNAGYLAEEIFYLKIF